MSCGNRFQCGLRKTSRIQFQPDKPSNPELYNENQKRLNDLLKAREEIDRQVFSPNTVSKSENIQPILNNTENTNFTSWKVPSTMDYNKK